MSQSARPRFRRGFTLIEMLVVIMIIAMLMGMTSFAVWKVILNAKVAKIAVEIDQLSQAMAGYKEKRMQYPPCMGTMDINQRKLEFLRHIALAFTNANYGSTPTHFNNLTTTVGKNYNYTVGTGTSGLDLHSLDQAEALVFWLGGFPTPVNANGPVANRRLFGFHRDEDDPFKRSVAFEVGTPLQFRTDPMFSFEEQRLTDVDRDGWLEYCPLPQRQGEINAPYVYFDSYTYGGSTNTITTTGWRHFCYPRPDNNNAESAIAQQVAQEFGLAAPMASMLDGAKKQTTRWANATGIQIICGGLDGKYGPGIPDGTDLKTVQRVITFPEGKTYFKSDGFETGGGLSREDMDNQTNLSNRTVDGARSESGQ